MTKGISTRLAAAGFGFAAAIALAQGAQAQEARETLTVELNALQPSDRGCRFTFIATNNLGAELTKAAFELVLFDTEGKVSRLTVVDFKDLPQGKTKVRQFDFAGLDCSKVGRVLVNDSTECAGSGVDSKACIQRLETKTLTGAVFGI
jgi:hypothetical protein